MSIFFATKGDFGGPLVCMRDGTFMLQGVENLVTRGCRYARRPSVYTRVTSHMDWIVSHVQGDASLCSKFLVHHYSY